MKHKITNHGPRHIVVCDKAAKLHKIDPGDSAVLDFVSIQHGDGRAHYQIEPADDEITNS